MNGFGSFLGNHLYSVMVAMTLVLTAASFLLRATRFRFAPQLIGAAVALTFLPGSLLWGGVADLFAALVLGVPVALSGLAAALLLR